LLAAIGPALLVGGIFIPGQALAQTIQEDLDPTWQRSNERHGYLWWRTAQDGVPDVAYYKTEGATWSFTTPVDQTWSHRDANTNVSWFYTVEGDSTANSWFRTTLPAKPGHRLVGFTLTSADKPGQGIGLNDGFYVFLDGQFSGTFASSRPGRPPLAVWSWTIDSRRVGAARTWGPR
jgi:hypothetical protein